MSIFFIIGLVSSIFQLVVLREFTFSIAKNEFSFIAGAGIWLAFCFLGSIFARKKSVLLSGFLPIAWAGVFCFSVVGIHLGKTLVGLSYYEASSLAFVLFSALLLIGGLGFLSGFLFCIISRSYSNKITDTPKIFTNFFIYEATGFFIGGVIFTFFLSRYCNPFIFTFLPLLLFLTSDLRKTKKILPVFVLIALGIVSVLSFRIVSKIEFQSADILKNIGSEYGPVILAKKYGTESLYVNGSLVSSSEDNVWNEEFIHTSFAASAVIKNVLFIGPYYGGQIEEILKYKISTLDCLDINPAFLSIGKGKLYKNDDSRVTFLVDDPRQYIKNVNKKYDFIVMNMPPPSSLAFNRYFSLEFFELVKKILTAEGFFSFHIPAKRDILGPRILKFDSCIVNTLDEVFKYRLLVPLDSMIVIANNVKALSRDYLVENFIRSGTTTDYFTVYHLKDLLDPSRRVYFEGMINKEIAINRDFYFRGFLYYSLLEQAKFYPDLRINIRQIKTIIIVIFVIGGSFAFLLNFSGKKREIICRMSFVGFMSIGLSSIIFILFQLYSGALFQKAGVLIGLFMLGLGSGSWGFNLPANKFWVKSKNQVYFYLAWVALAASLFFFVKFFQEFFHYDFIFYTYSFLSGALTGASYPLFIQLAIRRNFKTETVAASLYAADAGGAFLGTIFFSALLIPFFGLCNSLIMLLILILLFTAVVLTDK